MRVYVAGASQECEGSARAIGRLRLAGHVVTYDWTAEVRANKALGHRETEYSADEAGAYAASDLAAVAVSDIVWVRCPSLPNATRGAWAELGFAVARKLYDSERLLVVSGDWPQTIFTAFADKKFHSHAEALAWILALAPGSSRGGKDE